MTLNHQIPRLVTLPTKKIPSRTKSTSLVGKVNNLVGNVLKFVGKVMGGTLGLKVEQGLEFRGGGLDLRMQDLGLVRQLGFKI